MRSLVIVSLLAGAVFGLKASAPFPDGWVDLFTPPFTNAPTIMEGIGCVSGNLCFIPAGDSGVGFQIMQFDGKFNGEFTVMNNPEGVGINIYSTMGAGGTEAQPYAMATGFGIPSARYNSTTWYAPLNLLMASAIDVRFDTKAGNNVGLWNVLEPESWSFSTDGARSFKSINVGIINPPLPNSECMWPRYTSLGGANPNVAYQTFGNWPGNSAVNARSSLHQHRPAGTSGATRKGAPEHLLAKRVQKGLKGQACGYNAGITKTTDGGKTWSTVFADFTSGFYFNQIDCADELRCVVVGESIYNATGPTTGGRIFATKDGGKTWTQTYHVANTNGRTNTLMSVRFSVVNTTEVWAGGASQNNGNPEGIMLKSTDGGFSWTRYETLDYIAEVLDMSFTKDGNAFASAITEFQDSTILRYNAKGPAFTTPAPYTGAITQYSCSDNACSVCNKTSIVQQQCINTGGSTSQQFRCSLADDVVINLQYPLSSKCTFVAEQAFFQIGACYVNPNGPGTVMYDCGNGSSEKEDAIPAPRTIVGKMPAIRVIEH